MCGHYQMPGRSPKRYTYATLELADQHGTKECTGVLGMSDIFKGLGSVLACLGDEDLVTTRVLLDLVTEFGPEISNWSGATSVAKFRRSIANNGTRRASAVRASRRGGK